MGRVQGTHQGVGHTRDKQGQEAILSLRPRGQEGERAVEPREGSGPGGRQGCQDRRHSRKGRGSLSPTPLLPPSLLLGPPIGKTQWKRVSVASLGSGPWVRLLDQRAGLKGQRTENDQFPGSVKGSLPNSTLKLQWGGSTCRAKAWGGGGGRAARC